MHSFHFNFQSFYPYFTNIKQLEFKKRNEEPMIAIFNGFPSINM